MIQSPQCRKLHQTAGHLLILPCVKFWMLAALHSLIGLLWTTRVYSVTAVWTFGNRPKPRNRFGRNRILAECYIWIFGRNRNWPKQFKWLFSAPKPKPKPNFGRSLESRCHNAKAEAAGLYSRCGLGLPFHSIWDPHTVMETLRELIQFIHNSEVFLSGEFRCRLMEDRLFHKPVKQLSNWSSN